MLNIHIRTVPHEAQRYDTCGDWQYTKSGALTITVSDLGNWRMEVAVAIHELIECLLCRNDGVTTQQVDEFDMSYKGKGEPGDEPSAPYASQHSVATGVERIMTALLGVKWREYETVVDGLRRT